MDQPAVRPIYQRRNFYIDRDFQTRFIVKFCALVAAGTGLAIVILYMFSREATTVSFVDARVKVMTAADFLLPFMIQTLFIVMAFVSVGAVVVTLFVSHKIAGPLFRFKQTFKDLGAGNFTHQVRLRQGDQLLEVADDFNNMITQVRIHLVEAKVSLAGLRFEMESMGPFNAEDPRHKKFIDMQRKTSELEKALEFFKL